MAYQSVHTGPTIDTAVAEHNNLRQIILDTVYPVGSLYTSFNSTNPATTIGGIWTQIKDCFWLRLAAIMQLVQLAVQQRIRILQRGMY